ncbi:MAG: hypothetical protein C4297_13230 [Gemmataceae bacterium]
MDLDKRLDILAGSVRTELAGMSAGRPLRRGYKCRWVFHPTGSNRLRLMSLLMTNACVLNCHYCPARRDRNIVRTVVRPDELARVFDSLVRADLADGLFLTSGIPGRSQAMMDRMLDAVELIRKRYGFTGYIHLKILPGADAAQIQKACQLASRVSINLEAATEAGLRSIAPEKSLAEQILPAIQQIDHVRRNHAERLVPAGVTTQVLVGATNETDRDLVHTACALVRRYRLRRVHFAAFQPIRQTPMEHHPATSLLREHRLYQAEALVREYRFQPHELPFDSRSQLPLDADPKWLWAQLHPEFFPVEITRASEDVLVRVPGIGPRTAQRIVASRKEVASLRDLARLGVILARAAPFLTLRGRRCASNFWRQRAFDFDLPPGSGVTSRALSCASGISPCAFR